MVPDRDDVEKGQSDAPGSVLRPSINYALKLLLSPNLMMNVWLYNKVCAKGAGRHACVPVEGRHTDSIHLMLDS